MLRHVQPSAIEGGLRGDRFGRIDIWINNAGVGALGRFETVPLDDHVKVIETDLMGTLYGSYFAYRQFLHQGDGVLINMASELGRHTAPYYASYTAAKHGVVGHRAADGGEAGREADSQDADGGCAGGSGDGRRGAVPDPNGDGDQGRAAGAAALKERGGPW